MTKNTYPDGNMIFELTPQDVESAIRQFICDCHPETAKGFVINPYQGAQTIEVPKHFTAQR